MVHIFYQNNVLLYSFISFDHPLCQNVGEIYPPSAGIDAYVRFPIISRVFFPFYLPQSPIFFLNILQFSLFFHFHFNFLFFLIYLLPFAIFLFFPPFSFSTSFLLSIFLSFPLFFLTSFLLSIFLSFPSLLPPSPFLLIPLFFIL